MRHVPAAFWGDLGGFFSPHPVGLHGLMHPWRVAAGSARNVFYAYVSLFSTLDGSIMDTFTIFCYD